MENTKTDRASRKRTCMTVKELGAEMGIGRDNAYALARSEGFPAISIGKRIVIPVAAFEKWLEDQVNRRDVQEDAVHKGGEAVCACSTSPDSTKMS